MKKGTRLFLPKGFPKKVIPEGIDLQIVESKAEIDSKISTFVLKGGFRLYEQALLIDTPQGIMVITGCAHPGITHLLKEVKKEWQRPIYFVLGGFHLFRKNKKEIQEIVDEFKQLDVKLIAPCHCSGEVAIEAFQEGFQERFYKVQTGSIIHVR